MSVGLIPRLRPLLAHKSLALKGLLALSLVAVTLALQPADAADADDEGCAFPFTPTTYEGLRDRKLFLDTIELASFNMLFPGDPYFGLPDIEVGNRSSSRDKEPGKVPSVLLKSIAYIESSSRRAPAKRPSAPSARRWSRSTAATASPRSRPA